MQLEENLEEFSKEIENKEQFAFKEKYIFYESLFGSIFSIDSASLYDSNLGPKLKQFCKLLKGFKNQNETHKLYRYIQNKIEKLKKKIVVEFFKPLDTQSLSARKQKKRAQIDTKVQFRVKKKIQKVIYQSVAQKPSKERLERIGQNAERIVRRNSESLRDYQHKTLTLVKTLSNKENSSKICTQIDENSPNFQQFVHEIIFN